MTKHVSIAVILIIAWIFSVTHLAAGKVPLLSARTAYAQDDWKKEFDAICSETQDAMTFSPEKLNDLVARCDALQTRFESLDESQRKVMLKRLKMCRDFYVYVLQSKEHK